MLKLLLSNKKEVEYTPDPKEEKLAEKKENLSDIQYELECAYSDFNQATEHELVDACIYRIASLERMIIQEINEAKNIY